MEKFIAKGVKNPGDLELIREITPKIIEKLFSKKQLLIWQYLQIVEEAASGEIAEKSGVARPTVNQALDKLLRLKKIERIGLGRSTRYRKL